jgi:molybdopterin/thiamine biosynthesis adenylyltransferase/rhodanese-related sulfurtransferase/molybdopterin converting factor small subunit
MSEIVVRIPAPLRSLTGGASTLQGSGGTVGEVLRSLGGHAEGLLGNILDDQGRVRSFVNVYVGDTNIRSLSGLESPISEGEVISIIPAVAGGLERARDRRLAELRRRIPAIPPREAYELGHNGGVVIDVREPDEVSAGSPPGAIRIVRGYLELQIEDRVRDSSRPIALLCAGGDRSLLAADDLRRMGYANVCSIAGGFVRWKADGLPIEVPRTLDERGRERYSRHMLIPEVGEDGQLKLLSSRVLLVGAGGLGSPAAFYLAAAGVGTVGIVDDDVVDRSNLQRQILHTDARVGTPKAASARDTLLALNPDIEVGVHETRLRRDNVEEIFSGYDVVIDGTDNFQTRYLVNDACLKLGLPNVHGSIFRFEGQVSVFWPGQPDTPGPCYRCLYPELPPPELAPSCAEAGVLGVLPGVVGALEAAEAIKILLGRGEPLVGRLLHYDALSAGFRTLRVERDPNCRYCGDESGEFPGYVDYDQFCTGVSGTRRSA